MKENTRGLVNSQEGHLKHSKDGTSSGHGQREMHWSHHVKGQGKTNIYMMRKPSLSLKFMCCTHSKPLSSVNTFHLIWDTVVGTWASAMPSSWWRRGWFSSFILLAHQDSYPHYPTHHSSSSWTTHWYTPYGAVSSPLPKLHKDTRLLVDLGGALDMGVELTHAWAGEDNFEPVTVVCSEIKL